MRWIASDLLWVLRRNSPGRQVYRWPVHPVMEHELFPGQLAVLLEKSSLCHHGLDLSWDLYSASRVLFVVISAGVVD